MISVDFISIWTKPLLVNFAALPAIFNSTCFNRFSSPTRYLGTSLVIVKVRSTFFSDVFGLTIESTSCNVFLMSNLLSESSNLSASILEISNMSLIKPSRIFPLVWIEFTISSCSSVSFVLCNMSVIPMIPCSGVLISWLILARKSDLAFVADKASSLTFLKS